LQQWCLRIGAMILPVLLKWRYSPSLRLVATGMLCFTIGLIGDDLFLASEVWCLLNEASLLGWQVDAIYQDWAANSWQVDKLPLISRAGFCSDWSLGIWVSTWNVNVLYQFSSSMRHTWCGIGYLLNLAFAVAYILVTKAIKQTVLLEIWNICMQAVGDGNWVELFSTLLASPIKCHFHATDHRLKLQMLWLLV
jgi:hypothetical protein